MWRRSEKLSAATINICSWDVLGTNDYLVRLAGLQQVQRDLRLSRRLRARHSVRQDPSTAGRRNGGPSVGMKI